jgi:hypothetical protein
VLQVVPDVEHPVRTPYRVACHHPHAVRTSVEVVTSEAAEPDEQGTPGSPADQEDR